MGKEVPDVSSGRKGGIGNGLDVNYVSMPNNLDFALRPVSKGYITYDKLKDGSLTMYDLAILNDMIDVQNENEQRMMDAHKAKQDREAARKKYG